MSPKKVIIDCDTGVDDAEALMLGLAFPDDVEIVAITCANGNVDVDQVCLNTLRVLRVCQREQVPVYRGAHTPLLHKSVDGKYHHGEGGLGGIPDTDPPDIGLVQEEHAVNALVRLTKQHKGEITLVCLAPLSNIAMAIRMDPHLGSYLKEAVIMGGNLEGSLIKRRGNITTTGEFNFFSDPEAAYIALNDLKCPIKLVAWEPIHTQGFEWEWYDSLHKGNDSAKCKFHSAITKYPTYRKKELLKLPHYYSCDPVAMAVALNPLCIVEFQNLYCTVELKGELTRGQMVVDWNRALGREPNIEVITKLDRDVIRGYFEKMLL